MTDSHEIWYEHGWHSTFLEFDLPNFLPSMISVWKLWELLMCVQH